MNKIGKQRYQADHQLSPKNQIRSQRESLMQHKLSHPATMLLRKESQIELVKKRISALCVREQRYAHKTINTDLELQKKQAVQKESLRIQKLLQKQKNREANQLQILKHRNLKTRADNYYRSKLFKEKREQQAKEKSTFVRSRSRDNHSTISQNKVQNLQVKKGKSLMIYQSQKKAIEERNRYLQKRKEDIKNAEQRQNQHLMKLGSIKDHQLKELSKLELMMVEKSNTSRAAYEASRDRVASRTSKSRFEVNQIVKTSRDRKLSRHNISLNFN